MKNITVSPFVAWCTLLSGVIGLVGLIFLLLFYALEAPALLQSGEPNTAPLFGTLNDASYIFVALLLLPGVLALYRAVQIQGPTLSRYVMLLGVAGLSAMAVTQILYVPRIITSQQAGPFLTVSAGIVGAWLLLVCIAGRREGILPRGLVWLGILSGVGMILLAVTYFATGAPQVNDIQAELPGIPAMIGFGLGVLGQSIGWPVWAAWLGRFFMSHRSSRVK